QLFFAFRTELAGVAKDFDHCRVEPGVRRLYHLRQSHFVYDFDAVLICELLCIARVATKRDEEAMLNTSIGECSEKLAHCPDTDVPSLPMFALDGGADSVLLDHQVDAAIGVRAAASGDGIALFSIDQGDQPLKLKPIDGPKLVN